MSNRKWKRAGLILLGIFLFLGLGVLLLYLNRQKFYPKVEEVTYLQAALESDTAEVHVGIQVQNRAPIPFRIDSVNYQIRTNGSKLGWGGQIVGERLHAFTDEVLDFRLFLDTDRYRKHLLMHHKQDSLDLDVLMHVYIDPPLFSPHLFTIKRTLTTAVPKAPALKIDTLLVKSFSPGAGYHFQVNLNIGNTNLPDLRIEDLLFELRLGDSITVKSKIDTAFKIAKGTQVIEVPIRLETAEVVKLLRLKLGDRQKWPYDAKATAVVKSAHPLFEDLDVSLAKSGMADASKVGNGAKDMPSLKKLESLSLNIQEQKIFIKAGLLIHNPTILPLYIDSAQYSVLYQGKLIAYGSSNNEQTLPEKTSKELNLKLTVDTEKYKQLSSLAKGKKEIPLDVELNLIYDFKDSERQRITVKKTVSAPVPQNAGIKITDLKVNELDPDKGASILLMVEVENNQIPGLVINKLNYNLDVNGEIKIYGQTQAPITIGEGKTEVEIPLSLSAENINQLIMRMIQGNERWNYTFKGSANISAQNSLLQRTDIALQTSGTFDIGSKGTPDYMPEISKIDTLNAIIHYDTAWVHMYAAIYNTLPVSIKLTELEVAIIHENDTIGKSRNELNVELVPDTNTFAWHSLGIDFKTWEDHLKSNQHQDSILLKIPTLLYFELSDLGRQKARLDLDTDIPTPATPVTVFQKTKLTGIGFRSGLRFDAIVTVQNANVKGMEIKNIDYQVKLENGVDMCGKINRVYEIPVGRSEIKIPINLSLWESVKMLTRTLFGPPIIHYTINATANFKTANPKMQDVYLIFENKNQSNLQQKKTLDPPATAK